LHGDKPLSPLLDVNEPLKVHSAVYDITNQLRTPADATPTDAKAASAAFLKVNSKCFDATEQAMQGYGDLLPRTLKRMPFLDFRIRRSLGRGMFAVADALVDVLNRVRLNGILRIDELADVARSARDEAKQLAQGPGGAQNARAQAVFKLLDGPFQDMIKKQQQGKDDANKSQENFQQQAADVTAALTAANSRIVTLENTIAQLQQGALLSTPPVVPTPTITPHKGHKTETTPAPSATPTPASETRTLPRQ
jgi:hypothetical protein